MVNHWGFQTSIQFQLTVRANNCPDRHGVRSINRWDPAFPSLSFGNRLASSCLKCSLVQPVYILWEAQLLRVDWHPDGNHKCFWSACNNVFWSSSVQPLQWDIGVSLLVGS